jgi:hypothetical protein
MRFAIGGPEVHRPENVVDGALCRSIAEVGGWILGPFEVRNESFVCFTLQCAGCESAKGVVVALEPKGIDEAELTRQFGVCGCRRDVALVLKSRERG